MGLSAKLRAQLGPSFSPPPGSLPWPLQRSASPAHDPLFAFSRPGVTDSCPLAGVTCSFVRFPRLSAAEVLMRLHGVDCTRLEGPRKSRVPGTSVETRGHDTCDLPWGSPLPRLQPHSIPHSGSSSHSAAGGHMTQD